MKERQLLLSLERGIGHTFNNPALLLAAVTHRSYATERNAESDYQRLEFLGDSVIQLIVSEHLYNLYPTEREGKLTSLRSALVQQGALAAAARAIGLGEHLLLGKGEFESEGFARDSILCDAFEALAGALYLDAGIDCARQFILDVLSRIHADHDSLLGRLNPKGLLQEITQRRWNSKPEYRIKETLGPPHSTTFIVEVLVNGQSIASGEGSNRKNAEMDAAKKAIDSLAATGEGGAPP